MVLKRVVAFSAASLLAAVGFSSGGEPLGASVAEARVSQAAQERFSGIVAALMATIPIGGSSTVFYILEARRFVGYDEHVRGEAIVIHRVDTTGATGLQRIARVVDPDNNGNPNDASARWTPGETFTDAANGIEVKVTGATANGFGVTINPSDTTAPRIQGSDPSPGQRGVGLKPTIEVTFSEEVDTTTLTPANVELNRSGVTTPVAATVKPSPDGRSVTLVPGRLKKGKRYYVVLRSDSQGIKDLAGNPLSGGGGSLVNESGEYVYWWFMTRR